ncbi:basal cell adhesion molecule [Brienomyrus brachyistius]|uniref:basal cell adhesion molecule n=1 Tax=Brienomyrus brachyistius TaxID=42636 RepID=UPI0020B33E94|nr:basal cell adhesion molecule [Brienomyrus brachyistius]
MKGYIMLAYFALILLHWTEGALILKGPEGPVLEGDYVTLECLADVESNMSQVHFEKFSQRMQKWFRLEPYEMSFYRRCFSYDLDLNREPGRIVLSIFAIQSWTNGPYRCVSDNSSELYNSSESLSIPVHYMRDLSVYRDGGSYYNRYFSSLQDLRVPLGDNVQVECSTSASETPEYSWKKEGEDWVMPSSKLKLKKVRIEDSGQYTCTAQHPSVSRLSKTRTISITVLPEDAPWYESTQGRIILMTSAAGAGLLLLAVSVSICLCRRASKRKTKGPIDDHSQKKPIYKASVESLPSTSGDKQPLV